MGQFAYQARDSHGQASAGVLTADNLLAAGKLLRADGKTILSLEEHADAPAAAEVAPSRIGRVSRDEVIFFANQLAVMVDTGVPLSESLDSIAAQTTSLNFRAVLTDISEQVNSGVDFSTALARHPKVFGQLFVSMVKASEASGTMGKMLQRVAGYLYQQRQVVKRIKGALAYPMAMLGFCVLVVVGMLVFILPRFEKIYMGKKAVLPVPTRVLLAMSNGIISYWPVILAVLVAAVAGGIMLSRRPEGREIFDRVKINIPVLGGMYRKGCLARSLRTLSTMLSTGVSVLEGLEITAEVAGNSIYAGAWRGLSEKLREGASLSEEMHKLPLMPPSICQMVSSGEKSGRLSAVLERVAGFCEEDMDNAIRTCTSFIEPVMIIIMGGVVGGIALALLLPIFSISKLMSQ